MYSSRVNFAWFNSTRRSVAEPAVSFASRSCWRRSRSSIRLDSVASCISSSAACKCFIFERSDSEVPNDSFTETNGVTLPIRSLSLITFFCRTSMSVFMELICSSRLLKMRCILLNSSSCSIICPAKISLSSRRRSISTLRELSLNLPFFIRIDSTSFISEDILVFKSRTCDSCTIDWFTRFWIAWSRSRMVSAKFSFAFCSVEIWYRYSLLVVPSSFRARFHRFASAFATLSCPFRYFISSVIFEYSSVRLFLSLRNSSNSPSMFFWLDLYPSFSTSNDSILFSRTIDERRRVAIVVSRSLILVSIKIFSSFIVSILLSKLCWMASKLEGTERDFPTEASNFTSSLLSAISPIALSKTIFSPSKSSTWIFTFWKVANSSSFLINCSFVSSSIFSFSFLRVDISVTSLSCMASSFFKVTGSVWTRGCSSLSFLFSVKRCSNSYISSFSLVISSLEPVTCVSASFNSFDNSVECKVSSLLSDSNCFSKCLTFSFATFSASVVVFIFFSMVSISLFKLPTILDSRDISSHSHNNFAFSNSRLATLSSSSFRVSSNFSFRVSTISTELYSCSSKSTIRLESSVAEFSALYSSFDLMPSSIVLSRTLPVSSFFSSSFSWLFNSDKYFCLISSSSSSRSSNSLDDSSNSFSSRTISDSFASCIIRRSSASSLRYCSWFLACCRDSARERPTSANFSTYCSSCSSSSAIRSFCSSRTLVSISMTSIRIFSWTSSSDSISPLGSCKWCR